MTTKVLLLAFVILQASLAACDPFKEVPAPAHVVSAFSSDGFTVTRCLSFGGGLGCTASSRNSTILTTGTAKPSLYLTGPPYAMGFLTALLQGKGLEQMSTTYIELLPLELLTEWVARHDDSPIVKALGALLADYLEHGVVPLFEEAVGKGQIPEALIEEMSGLVDGAMAANVTVTRKAVITLNVGIDVMLSALYSGRLPGALASVAGSPLASRFLAFPEAVRTRALDMVREGRAVVKSNLGCNAFGVSRAALKNPAAGGGFFGRDFMLPTGGVYNLLAQHMIRVPADPARRATVSVGVPGFVGAVAIVNQNGLSLGVDVVRSALSTPENVGLNGMLLLRETAETADTLAEAVEVIAEAQRGCGWLYPLCDGAGDCAVIEAGASVSQVDPLSYVTDEKLKALLPSAQALVALRGNAAYRSGMWVRGQDYILPEQAFYYNAKLLALRRFPFNATAFTDPTGYIFSTFQEENAAIKTTGDDYFLPQRETDPDVVLVSNNAIIPEFRVTTMAPGPQFLIRHDATSPTWRYDRLNAILAANHGRIDWETAWRAITFLAPNQAPGFYPDPTPPSTDPMSALVEGSTSLVDLAKIRITTLSGYYCDGLIQTTLQNYL